MLYPRSVYFLFTLFLFACNSTKKTVVNAGENINPFIQAVQQAYAPDARTALFSVTTKGNTLTGETNLPVAKRTLLNRLDSAGISYVDSIMVLPEADVQNKSFGVVRISVANLRSAPRHPAELATQALLGTPLKVWKKKNGWYLVQTPDQYLSWVDGGGIETMDEASFKRWHEAKKIIYTRSFGFAYTRPVKEEGITSDLVYGNLLTLSGEENNFYKCQLPDGRTAYISKEEAAPYTEWISTRQPTGENLVRAAKQMMGMPYLWGGTSVKGMDCSGFTKTVYFMNGLVLPRDASQQVQIGKEVNTKEGWQNLQPGDLLFFGVPAKEGKGERVIHVGMWIGGNQEFIHSSGLVRISSFNPQAPNYDEAELKRFLRVKRITPQDVLIDLRKEGLY